ncbi:hypothetical protein NC651_012057 [Populus alba x Populus x berolinensis]|nr:hypothetical protein NC651_012057 [Populus alba x Populus x berolinensis]
MPPAHYEGGSFHKSKNLPRSKERKHPIQDSHSKLRQLPSPNGIPSKVKDHPPENTMLTIVYHVKYFQTLQKSKGCQGSFSFLQADIYASAIKVFHEMVNAGVEPNVHTYGALIDGCARAGQIAKAFGAYGIMRSKNVKPDRLVFNALITACGQSGAVDRAFDVLAEMTGEVQPIDPDHITVGALIKACTNAGQVDRAQDVYNMVHKYNIKGTPEVYTIAINSCARLAIGSLRASALIDVAGHAGKMDAAFEIIQEAKAKGAQLGIIPYSSLMGACCNSNVIVLQKYLSETSLALMVYRGTIAAGEKPTIELVSQVLGCLQIPCDATLKNRHVENLCVTAVSPRYSNLCSLVDGFGEYDPRAFSLLEEAASLGIVPCVSFKESPITMDAKQLQIHIAEVYFLTILKGLKHRLAAGAKLPNVTILLPVEKAQVITLEGEKTINVAQDVNRNLPKKKVRPIGILHAVKPTSMEDQPGSCIPLRRLGLPYQGNESYGKIRINGISLRRWLQPKLDSPFSGKPGEWSTSLSRLGKGISFQQRNIRTDYVNKRVPLLACYEWGR